MEDCYFPDVVQVIPFEDYTVDVYFDDGKIVRYDVTPFSGKRYFSQTEGLTGIHKCLYHIKRNLCLGYCRESLFPRK